jgi:hypothetical protein
MILQEKDNKKSANFEGQFARKINSIASGKNTLSLFTKPIKQILMDFCT